MHKITYDYHELDCDLTLDHEFECDNIKDYDEGDSEAIEEAEQLAKNGDYNGEGADVEFEIYRVVNDIRDDEAFHSGSITIEPTVPECDNGEHKWQPQDIGCDENKGCFSSGGSLICHTECKKCGLKKSIDYWDHDLDCPHEGKIEYSK